jgi:Domain of unknown function (DUF4190)
VSTPPQPGAPPPPATWTPDKTNGFALASFFTAVFAIVPVAIVLGILALRQVKRRRQRGRGLAIWGIAIACAWVVGSVSAYLYISSHLVERDALGRITQKGWLTQYDLVTGDCLNDPKQTTLLLTAVPCGEPHDAQVFAAFDLEGDDYPGDDSARRRAAAGCRHRLADSTRSYRRLVDEVTFFYPEKLDWEDDRAVTCFANFATKRRDERTDSLESLLSRADRPPGAAVLY